MNENSNMQHATRYLRTHDLVNGEELLIVYFPKEGEIAINGYSVNQAMGFSGLPGQTVFHQVLGNKKYTVATESIREIYW